MLTRVSKQTYVARAVTTSPRAFAGASSQALAKPILSLLPELLASLIRPLLTILPAPYPPFHLTSSRPFLPDLVIHSLSRFPQYLKMAPATDNAKRIEEAQKLAKSEPAKAKAIYQEVLSKDPGSSDAAVKNFETALVGLGELYRDQKKVNDLAELVRQTRSVLSSFAKAKTAKLGM